jgi:hypothetical protein
MAPGEEGGVDRRKETRSIFCVDFGRRDRENRLALVDCVAEESSLVSSSNGRPGDCGSRILRWDLMQNNWSKLIMVLAGQ